MQKLATSSPAYLYLFGLVFLLKLLEACFPFGHGDALYYHLVIPKLIYHRGLSWMYENFQEAFQSGIVEFFWLPLYALFKNTMATQLVAQVSHFLGGLALGSLLLGIRFGAVAAIAGLTLAKGADFFLYAKTDGFLASLSLLCFCLLFDDRFKRYQRWGWVLLGLLPAIKLNGLFVSSSFGVIALVKIRPFRWKNLGLTFIGVLPFLGLVLRNYLYLESPLFPGLLGVFPGVIPEGIIEYYQDNLARAGGIQVLSSLKLFAGGKVLMWALIPLGFWVAIKKQWSKLLPLFSSLLIFFMYLGINGEVNGPRFIFPCYFLNLYFIFSVLSNFKNPKLLILLCLLSLVDSRLDHSLKRIKKAFKTPPEQWSSRFIHLTGFWRYIPSQGQVKILTNGFSNQFYLPPSAFLSNARQNHQGHFLFSCKDLRELTQFEYFILWERSEEGQCEKQIREQGLFIAKIDDYSLYQKNGF